MNCNCCEAVGIRWIIIGIIRRSYCSLRFIERSTAGWKLPFHIIYRTWQLEYCNYYFEVLNLKCERTWLLIFIVKRYWINTYSRTRLSISEPVDLAAPPYPPKRTFSIDLIVIYKYEKIIHCKINYFKYKTLCTYIIKIPTNTLVAVLNNPIRARNENTKFGIFFTPQLPYSSIVLKFSQLFSLWTFGALGGGWEIDSFLHVALPALVLMSSYTF